MEQPDYMESIMQQQEVGKDTQGGLLTFSWFSSNGLDIDIMDIIILRNRSV